MYFHTFLYSVHLGARLWFRYQIQFQLICKRNTFIFQRHMNFIGGMVTSNQSIFHTLTWYEPVWILACTRCLQSGEAFSQAWLGAPCAVNPSKNDDIIKVVSSHWMHAWSLEQYSADRKRRPLLSSRSYDNKMLADNDNKMFKNVLHWTRMQVKQRLKNSITYLQVPKTSM